MKRSVIDRAISRIINKFTKAIATCIVWLENLQVEINTRRFAVASKQVQQQRMQRDTYKIINQNGTTIATFTGLKLD